MCMTVGDSRPVGAFVATDTRICIDGVYSDPGGKIIDTGSGWAVAAGNGKPFHVAMTALRNAGPAPADENPMARAEKIVSAALAESGFESRGWFKHPWIDGKDGVSTYLIDIGSRGEGLILLTNGEADEGFHSVGIPYAFSEQEQDDRASALLRDSFLAGRDLASRIRVTAEHFERTHREAESVSGVMEIGYIVPTASGPVRGFLRGKASEIARTEPSEIFERFTGDPPTRLPVETLVLKGWQVERGFLNPTMAGTARALMKGYQSGYTKDDVAGTGVVAFSPVFQNAPTIRLSGGKAANATYPYDDFAAVGSTASGFTCKAQNKSKGTITARVAEFTASLTATTVGGTVGPATLSNAPAYDNNYNARFKLTVSCVTPPEEPSGTVTCVVAIETSVDGSTAWTEYGTRSKSVSRSTNGTTTTTYSGQEVTVNVQSLTSSSKARLKLKSITYTGGAQDTTQTLEGYDFSPTGEGHGVTYSTSSGYTQESKTPDADDYIFYEAWESVS